ncbi:MAG: TolC family protein [Bacteroidales bacterium]|nr:TolC family protein [Bacteroidales bacterium]
MKHTILIKIFLLVILPFAGLTQQDSIINLTVNQAMDYAIQYNTEIQNARIDVEIADQKVWETTTIGLPQISASGSYMNNLSLATQLIPAEFFGGEPGEFAEIQFGTKHNFAGTLTVSQLIFSGSYLVGLQAVKVYRNISEQSLDKSEKDTKANIALTYYSILMAEENKKTLQENHESMNDLLKQTTAIFENGLIEETEVDKLNIAVISLENTIKSLSRQIDYLYLLLKIQLGIERQQSINLTDDLNNILLEINIDGLLNKGFVLEEHIDYKLVKTQEELMALDVKRYKSEYLPTLSAFYNFQENAMRNEFSLFDGNEKWFESSMLGIQLDVPIFNSGLKRSKVQQAKLELEKVSNTKKVLESNLYSLLLQKRNEFITGRETLENSQKNMQISKKVLNNISIKHQKGMASSLELTLANSDYLTTISEYTQSIVNLLNAKIELEKILNDI